MLRHPKDCVDCLEAGRIIPACALCRTEYNYGEDHGGKWCSEYCRFSSTYLKRNLAGELVMKSQELWEAFHRDWTHQPDLKSEDIPPCPYAIREDFIIHRKGQRNGEDYRSLLSKLRQATERKKSLPPSRRWSKKKTYSFCRA